MVLNIIIDDHSMDIDVPETFLAQAEESLAKLDAQMDQGLQLGRDWISQPTLEQRCQRAADKLLSAIDAHKEGLAMLSAAYILTRRPHTKGVHIDNQGEPRETTFID